MDSDSSNRSGRILGVRCSAGESRWAGSERRSERQREMRQQEVLALYSGRNIREAEKQQQRRVTGNVVGLGARRAEGCVRTQVRVGWSMMR